MYEISCAQRVVVGEEGREKCVQGADCVVIAPGWICRMKLQIGILFVEVNYFKNDR